jgi:flagellar hook-basal body complex protein FliE
MNIEAVAASSAIAPAAGLAPMPALSPLAQAPAGATGQFGQIDADGLGRVNEGLLAAQEGMQSLATGTAPDLHRVMIQIEESQLSFQLMLQVRNRLLESYQDVMKMQV